MYVCIYIYIYIYIYMYTHKPGQGQAGERLEVPRLAGATRRSAPPHN